MIVWLALFPKHVKLVKEIALCTPALGVTAGISQPPRYLCPQPPARIFAPAWVSPASQLPLPAALPPALAPASQWPGGFPQLPSYRCPQLCFQLCPQLRPQRCSPSKLPLPPALLPASPTALPALEVTTGVFQIAKHSRYPRPVMFGVDAGIIWML